MFKYHNTVELPMLGGDGPDDDAGAAGVDVGNRANNLYLKKNYQELSNDDDDDNNDNSYVDGNIELVSDLVAISETIIDVDEEIKRVAEK